MSERRTLLLLIYNFLNYLIDKFHPLELINGGIFGSWSIVGFYSSAFQLTRRAAAAKRIVRRNHNDEIYWKSWKSIKLILKVPLLACLLS